MTRHLGMWGGISLLLAGCAALPGRPVGAIVRAQPPGAMIVELGTDRALHAAPAAIYYGPDRLPQSYAERACFRVAGFAAVWPQGEAARTPPLIDLCRPGNQPAELLLVQPSPPPDPLPEDDQEAALAVAVEQFLQSGQAVTLRCVQISVGADSALHCY